MARRRSLEVKREEDRRRAHLVLSMTSQPITGCKPNESHPGHVPRWLFSLSAPSVCGPLLNMVNAPEETAQI